MRRARNLILIFFAFAISVKVIGFFATTFNVQYETKWIDLTYQTKNERGSYKPDVSLPDSLTVIPKVVYMFWESGWNNTNILQTICLKSFQRLNKDFLIKPLNLSEAEDLIDRRRYYSDAAWNFAKVQAKSDIIRLELLAKYGGVWADASVHCNEPLSNWLNDAILRVNFFAYERRDKDVSKDTYPFIASWFLAAAKGSIIVRAWRDATRNAWSRTPYPTKPLKYYWMHRLFRYLVMSNSTIRDLFDQMPFYDAGGPHCNHPKYPMPHVYKLKSGSCWRERKEIITKYNKTRLLTGRV